MMLAIPAQRPGWQAKTLPRGEEEEMEEEEEEEEEEEGVISTLLHQSIQRLHAAWEGWNLKALGRPARTAAAAAVAATAATTAAERVL